MLRLRDTASGRVKALPAKEPGSLGLYVCGPTVYGSPHIGHGRFALVYDVLRRYLESEGVRVTHVSNVTDVDDKIIERARVEERSWRDVAQDAEAEWWDVMDRMAVLRPSVVPHATEYIDQMVEFVGQLLASGHAYDTDNGVYLDTSSVPDYGLLKHQDLAELWAGARVEVDEYKRSPIDFVLWKKAKPNEPTWAARFGDGRPGWHTECVVMSLALLGEGFDLHGGGEDLIFPHHENERAQAVADDKTFARHWMHNGLVRVGGEKMSKSLGNTTTLSEVLAASDPRAYRLLVLRSHYRQPIEVAERQFEDAAQALGRIDALARRFADAPFETELETVVALRAAFRRAMDDDLDTPAALGALFSALRQANALADGGDDRAAGTLAKVVLELLAVLGVTSSLEQDLPAEIAAMVRDRDAARAGRDFAAADELRQEIERRGFVVEDTPEGTRVYR
ncbi:MAG: cysteine--tRNA ligase [Acidimicrobiales bacterium]